MSARLAFGVCDGLAQRRFQRFRLALGHNGVQPGLNSHFNNLQPLLRAENDAGARVLAQNEGNPFHPLLGQGAQIPGDSHLPGSEFHFHSQPPLLHSFSQQDDPAGDYGFYSIYQGRE